jgi:hypothetical protein
MPFVVTPGRVSVDATAPGYAPFHQRLVVPSGASIPVAVVLAPLRADSARAHHPALGAGPFVLLGVGVLTFGAAGLFFGLRNATLSQVDARCMPPDAQGVRTCPLDGSGVTENYFGTARTYNVLNAVALGVGGAVAAAGLTWLVVAATRPTPHASLARARFRFTHVAVQPASGGASFTLGATW